MHVPQIFLLITRRSHAAGERNNEGGEEGDEKESSKAERLLGLGYGRRRVRRWPGKSSRGHKLFTRSDKRVFWKGVVGKKKKKITICICYM